MLRTVRLTERHGDVDVIFIGPERVNLGVLVGWGDGHLPVTILQVNLEIPRYLGQQAGTVPEGDI